MKFKIVIIIFLITSSLLGKNPLKLDTLGKSISSVFTHDKNGTTYNSSLSTINHRKEIKEDKPNDLADHDDDNDGILDSNEGFVDCSSSTNYIANQYYGFGAAFSNFGTNGNAPITNYFTATDASGLPWFPTTHPLSQTTAVSTSSFTSPSSSSSVGELIVIEYYVDFSCHTNIQFEVRSNSDWDYNALYIAEDGIVTNATQAVYLPSSNSLSGFSSIYNPSGDIFIRHYHIDDNANSTGRIFWKSDQQTTPILLEFNTLPCSLPTCASLDTDGDGTPDYLDTDSDNDGCPDAIEGGGSFTYDDIANGQLTGGEDANGVPTAASGGQTIGTSQDNTQQSTECDACNNSSTLFTDTDSDGVGDDCDLDDDNDGILDNNEGCISEVMPLNLAFDGVTANGVTVTGTYFENGTNLDNGTKIDNDDFTFLTGVTSLTGVNISHLAAEVNNLDEPLTFNFSSGMVSEVYFHVNSLDQVNLQMLSASNPNIGFEVLSGENFILTGTGNDLIIGDDNPSTRDLTFAAEANDDGTSADFTIRFYAIDASIPITSLNLRFVESPISANIDEGFQIAMEISGCQDTDGDETPDYLDTDSDNDGCPDAIEGGGSFTNIQNDTLTGGVDANGVPTVANGGQTVGTSQDSTQQSSACTVPPIITKISNFTVGCDGTGNIEDINRWLSLNGGAKALQSVLPCTLEGIGYISNPDEGWVSGLGFNPAPMTSAPASSSTGQAIEYQWQYINGSTWTDLVGETNETYDPPTLSALFPSGSELFEFRRLTREVGCSDWTASNTVYFTSYTGNVRCNYVLVENNTCEPLTIQCWENTYWFTFPNQIAPGRNTVFGPSGANYIVRAVDGSGNILPKQISGSQTFNCNPSFIDTIQKLTINGADCSPICDNITWTNDFTSLNTDSCGRGTTTVTFTATDDCGNTVTRTADFIINDTNGTCPCVEICNDGIDNDGDGLIDCDDTDCILPAPDSIIMD